MTTRHVPEHVLDLTTDQDQPSDRASTPLEAADELLGRVAFALNSTLDLREVLHRLAELALEATTAERCSLFVLHGRELRPMVALGHHRDESLWSAFRRMGPIELDDALSSSLREGRAIAVDDARASDWVPDDWTERFSLGSLVLVPLLALREPCGLMVVDRSDVKPFARDELLRLEALASCAGVAVRNARLFEATRHRARLQEALARCAGALASQVAPSEIIERLVDAFADLLGAPLCGIGLFDAAQRHITTVASRGLRAPDAPLRLEELPPTVHLGLVDVWNDDPSRAVWFTDEPWFTDYLGGDEAGVTRYLVLPISGGGRVQGAVVAGFDERTQPDAEAEEAAKALSAVAAATLERSDLLERLAVQVRRLEVLYALSAALAERADADALVRKLNELLADDGIEVAGLSFRNRRLRRHLDGQRPTPEETAGLRDGCDRIALADGSLAVPMRIDRRVAGTLRVRPVDLSDDERSFVEALASGVAQVASRGALRAELEDAARERAVASERDRIAMDLHDTVGQHLVGIGLFARRCADGLPGDSRWSERLRELADLADDGKWEIQQSIRALSFVPSGPEGLVPAVRSLASSFQSDSGITVCVDVRGEPAPLSVSVERALYRVANEALTNAWRHARCAFVRVEIAFSPDEVRLLIRDDGIGLDPRGATRGLSIGITAMRRAVAEVDGLLHVRNATPRGVTVEATVRADHR